MNEENYLATRKIEDKQKQQSKALSQLKKAPNTLIVPLLSGGNINLNTAAIELGQLLLNDLPALKEKDNYYYNSWYREVNVLSKRYKRFNELCETPTGLVAYQDLLTYFYGAEHSLYVLKAWDKIKEYAYQKDYNRRCFRAPNNFEKTRVNQINFLIRLNSELSADLTMEEYIIYDYEIGGYGAAHKALLWATAIDEGNEKILELLIDIVYQRHEKGKVSASIIKALLLANRKEGWKAVEDLLLSAQRQEGLRQTILECLDETSLGALQHFIKVILDHNLLRFSSVVRAVDTWAGLAWESAKATTVKRFLEAMYYYLRHPEQIANAIKEKDNTKVYMALCVQGIFDVEQCTPLLHDLYDKGTQEKQFLALYFANQTQLYSLERGLAVKAVNSSVPKVLHQGLMSISAYNRSTEELEKAVTSEMFVNIEKQLPILMASKGKVVTSTAFNWITTTIDPKWGYQALLKLTNPKNQASVERLLPHLSKMDADTRTALARMILPEYATYQEDKVAKTPPNDFQKRFAFSILKDRSSWVQDIAMNALSKAQLADEEIIHLEGLLTRKSGNVRKRIINWLLQLSEIQIKISVERLLVAKHREQRLAGLDILNRVSVKDAYQTWAKEQASLYNKRSKLTEKELILIDNIIGETVTVKTFSIENGFGLFNPQQKAPVPTLESPTSGEYYRITQEYPLGLSKAGAEIDALLLDLAALFEKHKAYEYEVTNWDGHSRTVVLGNTLRKKNYDDKEFTREEYIQNYPLADVWINWFEESGLRPLDIFLIQLRVKQLYSRYNFPKDFKTKAIIEDFFYKVSIPKIGEYDWQNPINGILDLLEYAFPYKNLLPFLDGLIANMLIAIPKDELSKTLKDESYYNATYYNWQEVASFSGVYSHYQSACIEADDELFTAYWQKERWIKAQLPTMKRGEALTLSPLEAVVRAYQLDLITKDELYDRLMQTDAIHNLTAPKCELMDSYPFLSEMIDVCRNRILEIELTRGDSTTVVTNLAGCLKRIYGTERIVAIFKALGKDTLYRGYSYWSVDTKKELLSQLLKNCYPSKEDTPEQFHVLIKSSKITEKQLIETAMYAQQWIPLVSRYLGWKGLKSAIWWLHAHTNAHHDAETEAEIARYSKVNLMDFADGAVDVEWFKEAYKTLGKRRWEMLYTAAKYICDGRGHKRAHLYADVLLAKTKITAITKKVKDKRNQDYLRVYGLVPLSKKTPQKDLLKRYQYLQQFLKESKQFGAQKQTSEALAVRIAMDNLARTANYSDPIRLTWAMEALEAQEILSAAKPLIFDKVRIELQIDDLGKSSIKCYKADKLLNNIPAKLRKEKTVVALKAFNKTLRNQYTRTRKSLEQAMVAGDVFLKEEVQRLIEHPVVRPMLEKLLVKSGENLGFLKGEMLQTLDGTYVDLSSETIIAHCYDIYKDGNWSAYQRLCFDNKLVQPFKQIFRELYLPTEDELKHKTISRRYAGHQVQPKKTVALLKTRSWTVDYEDGLQRVYHKEGLIAKMYAMADWFSPADVESPTLETIEFVDRKNGKAVAFDQIDPRVFSEVMRDIDLVVSVAHAGGVDPEASHSTIEMRAAIVHESSRLFRLKNVAIKKRHVYINGQLGDYTVHLGSAICHKIPGRYLSILPVHSQHRGRIFLPFVDEDPKSSEVMSKVLLLSKDDKIQDPTILRQIKDKVLL